ncbi:MAG: putative cysteine proteinase [Streblomastix strix]|uniref:Putative cysteine proteinase n=1 Tax=Streblomastix strix TaxID=222440 RepID=A0A5J4VRN1_9EUKA|nr:MAG: putative cysteine proteinase [Streblomastix strix]
MGDFCDCFSQIGKKEIEITRILTSNRSYLAPEALLLTNDKNEAYKTTTNDVWAFGMILAETILGEQILKVDSDKERFIFMKKNFGEPDRSAFSFVPDNYYKKLSDIDINQTESQDEENLLKNKLIKAMESREQEENEILKRCSEQNGQYHLKLFINGCWRMIAFDDLLPSCIKPQFNECDGQSRMIMSAESKIEGQIWVSLLEKGYLACVGEGYDSAGLNFLEAVFAFCQWIPEYLQNTSIFWKKDYEWKKLVRRVKLGNILASISISKDEQIRYELEMLGLNSHHQYALIDIAEVGGIRLLKIRNPHGTSVWRGRLSGWDMEGWTQELRVATRFIPAESEEEYKKDGCFWIDVEDAKIYFNSIEVCWNPILLPFRQESHFIWQEQYYMIKDEYTQEIPKNKRIIVGQNDIIYESFYCNGHFALLQIGLFDEDIHQTEPQEPELTGLQQNRAIINDNGTIDSCFGK